MASKSKNLINNKKAAVHRLQSLVENKNILFISLESISANSLRQIRRTLGESSIGLVVQKKTILERVFQKTKYFEDLKSIFHAKKLGFAYTDKDVFTMHQIIDDSGVPSFAKPRMILENDIVVQDGDTGFKPGPFLSELGKVGLPSVIKNGTIHIRKKTTLIPSGTPVTEDQASVLKRLNVIPLTEKLEVLGGGESGITYHEAILRRYGEPLVSDLRSCAGKSVGLALGLRFVTDQTVSALLQQNQRRFIHLAKDLRIPSRYTIDQEIQRSVSRMKSLQSIEE